MIRSFHRIAMKLKITESRNDLIVQAVPIGIPPDEEKEEERVPLPLHARAIPPPLPKKQIPPPSWVIRRGWKRE